MNNDYYRIGVQEIVGMFGKAYFSLNDFWHSDASRA